MKNYFLITIVMAFLVCSVTAQTAGELTVNVTTSPAGGNYSPRNVLAIWIEDNEGNFVKTLLAYAQSRKTHLNNWQASTTAAGSAYNTVDAITGATKSNHSTRTCYWNATNVSGENVDDGTYKLWMELTDKNSTGNYSSFSFNIGEEEQTITPSNVPSFESISIIWSPTSTDIPQNTNNDKIVIYPNPTSGDINFADDNINEIEIRNVAGELIFKGLHKNVNIENEPNGIYFVKIKQDNKTVVKKILKQ